VAVDVCVEVGEAVAVNEGVTVAVCVAVDEAVALGVRVAVGVCVGVSEAVAVNEGVTVGVRVAVNEGVAVDVPVAVGEDVVEGVCVTVKVAVGGIGIGIETMNASLPAESPSRPLAPKPESATDTPRFLLPLTLITYHGVVCVLQSPLPRKNTKALFSPTSPARTSLPSDESATEKPKSLALGTVRVAVAALTLLQFPPGAS
jgi:hypothetical protein